MLNETEEKLDKNKYLAFKTFSYAFKSNVVDDTDGIFAFFQTSIKTWKEAFKTWMFEVFAVFFASHLG